MNVVPITLPGDLPLKHYVSMITTDVIAVGSSKDAEDVLHVNLFYFLLFFFRHFLVDLGRTLRLSEQFLSFFSSFICCLR